MSKTDMWNWLDGDKTVWDGSNSAHQPDIERSLLHLIKEATKEELEAIGDKLARLKSNFVVCMLIRHNDITPRHRLNAFRALAKRRKQEIPRYLRGALSHNKLAMTYTELSMLGPVKLMKTIMTFYRHDDVKWKMTEKELDKLLFPSSLKMPTETTMVKKRIKRLINGIDKKQMLDLLVNDDYEKIKNSEKDIKKMILRGFHGYEYQSTESLEKLCYDRKLLTL